MSLRDIFKEFSCAKLSSVFIYSQVLLVFNQSSHQCRKIKPILLLVSALKLWCSPSRLQRSVISIWCNSKQRL